MADNTTVLVEQTNYHCPSLVVHMLLTDLFLEFLLTYKGTANFKTDKAQICANDFKAFSNRYLLDRTLANTSTAIWPLFVTQM